MTTCCEISCFFENYGQEVEGTNTGPQQKSWGPVSHGLYGCCAYGLLDSDSIRSDCNLVWINNLSNASAELVAKVSDTVKRLPAVQRKADVRCP